MRANEDVVEQLRLGYLRKSAGELHRETGISAMSIRMLAWKRKWRHDEETERRLGVRWVDGRYTTGKLYHGKTVREIVMEYYPTMTSLEIASKFGCTQQAVISAAHRYGVEHNVDCKKRIAALRVENGNYPFSAESRKRISDCSRKNWRRFKVDKWRKENGIAQRTNLRFSIASDRVKKKMKYIACYRGYYRDCVLDSYTLFYDEQTRRFSPHYRQSEEWLTSHYGIIFRPTAEYERKMKEEHGLNENESV